MRSGFSRLSPVVASIVVSMAPAASGAEAAATVGPVLWQPSMNVFRRFGVAEVAMFEFYGDVLGFEQLATLNPGAGVGVARFQAGGSELKLTAKVSDRVYVPGGVRDATGVRLLTFFFPDESALKQRFERHGLAAPEFKPAGPAGRRFALVTDPDGQTVELVVVPGAPAAVYEQIEIGFDAIGEREPALGRIDACYRVAGVIADAFCFDHLPQRRRHLRSGYGHGSRLRRVEVHLDVLADAAPAAIVFEQHRRLVGGSRTLKGHGCDQDNEAAFAQLRQRRA